MDLSWSEYPCLFQYSSWGKQLADGPQVKGEIVKMSKYLGKAGLPPYRYEKYTIHSMHTQLHTDTVIYYLNEIILTLITTHHLF